MTDRPTPDPGDRGDLPEVDAAFEEASARIDGEAGEREAVSAVEPVAAAGSRHLAAIAGRVADVPPAPAALLDEHVATALAAFGEEALGAGGDRAAVTRLTARSAWWQRAPLGAVAAAVVVVALAGAIGVAVSGDRSDDQDTATAAMDADTSGGDSGAESAESADDLAAAGGSAPSAYERASFPGYDELAESLALDDAVVSETLEEDPGSASEPAAPPALPDAAEPTGEAAPAGCDAVAVSGVDPSTVEQVLPVVVEGRAVSAIVHTIDGRRRLTAVDEATCAVDEERGL
jgi:hypothetical protein